MGRGQGSHKHGVLISLAIKKSDFASPLVSKKSVWPIFTGQ